MAPCAPGKFLGTVGRAVVAVFGVEIVAAFAEPGLNDAVAAGGFDLGVVVVEVVEEAELDVVEVDGLFGYVGVEFFAFN